MSYRRHRKRSKEGLNGSPQHADPPQKAESPVQAFYPAYIIKVDDVVHVVPMEAYNALLKTHHDAILTANKGIPDSSSLVDSSVGAMACTYNRDISRCDCTYPGDASVQVAFPRRRQEDTDSRSFYAIDHCVRGVLSARYLADQGHLEQYKKPDFPHILRPLDDFRQGTASIDDFLVQKITP